MPLPFMYCDPPARISSIRKPVDATHAGAGSVTLVSGANLEIDGAPPGAQPPDSARFIARLRATDRIEICYAPPEHFADAGPTARMAIAGNARTGDYIFTLTYPANHRGRA